MSPSSEPLLLAFEHPTSRRTAVIAEEADSVWLYLTRPDEQRPERDAWLFNLPGAPQSPDPARYRARGAPPPAPASLLTPGGVRDLPAADAFTVVWSPDGESVAVLLDDEPVGALLAGDRRGMSRNLRQACAWGSPWEEARFRAAFTVP